MRRGLALSVALALASPGCGTSRALRTAAALPTDGTTLTIVLALVVVGAIVNVATDHGDSRPPMSQEPYEPAPHDPAALR